VSFISGTVAGPLLEVPPVVVEVELDELPLEDPPPPQPATNTARSARSENRPVDLICEVTLIRCVCLSAGAAAQMSGTMRLGLGFDKASKLDDCLADEEALRKK
jgi:hypothetical protein